MKRSNPSMFSGYGLFLSSTLCTKSGENYSGKQTFTVNQGDKVTLFEQSGGVSKDTFLSCNHLSSPLIVGNTLSTFFQHRNQLLVNILSACHLFLVSNMAQVLYFPEKKRRLHI